MPRWQWRGRVAEAMIRLIVARLLVTSIPLHRWRRLLGPLNPQSGARGRGSGGADGAARLLARAVVRGAARLPFETKCLPRAIALHTLLRRTGHASQLVIGVLDSRSRTFKQGSLEDLHAWVESHGEVIIGALDEPFHPLVRFG